MKLKNATVKLLDGGTRHYELSRDASGEALFNLVCADISLQDSSHFSLCFYDENRQRHWIYNDKKITKQLKDLPWTFSLEVKFYPLDLSKLTDSHARHNFYLQLRHDVFTGRLPVTLQTHALLGSLAAQAEFGDAVDTADYGSYLREAHIAPDMNEQLAMAIAELQTQHRGMSELDAQKFYMEKCHELPTYGIFTFPAKDLKNDPVQIGVGAQGISIYKDSVRMHKFNWQNIIKISYRRSTFSIKVKPWELEPKKEATRSYKLDDFRQAKRVFKCAVEHHTFFRLVTPTEQPAKPPRRGLFSFGTERFSSLLRTRSQQRTASEIFEPPAGLATISKSKRISQSLDDINKSQIENASVFAESAETEIGSPAMSYKMEEEVKAGKSEESGKENEKEVAAESVSSVEHMQVCNDEQNGDDETERELVQKKKLKLSDRTVETLTYKMGRSSPAKMRVDLQVTVFSDDPIDHDAELSRAILKATRLNSELIVEKIEMRQTAV